MASVHDVPDPDATTYDPPPIVHVIPTWLLDWLADVVTEADPLVTETVPATLQAVTVYVPESPVNVHVIPTWLD